MMSANESIFYRTTDEAGNEYFCPFIHDMEHAHTQAPVFEDCVEATTVGRYAGSINVRGKSTDS